MFDDNHIDDLMRSVLDSGQEEVPARVWDGISEGLDRIERRKRVVLWARRAGVTAAAAAIALGVFLNMDKEQTIVPTSKDSQMIAVVEPKAESVSTEENEITIDSFRNLTAYVKPEIKAVERPVATEDEDTARPDQLIDTEITDNSRQSETGTQSQQSETSTQNRQTAVARPASDVISSIVETSDTFKYDDSWIDDVEFRERKKIGTSFVISGVAGTNNPQPREGLSPMKSPALGKQYTKTTVEQTSTETLYGIPLSFGAGIRLHFTERWSLGMGLNYTLLTSKFNGKYIKVTDGVEDAPIAGNVRNVQHYIGIPLNAYYDIVSKDFVNLYAYAGGTVEKCILNKYQIQATTDINHSEDVKGVQLSVNAGIGVEFRLGRYVGLYIDPSLRYYFNNGQPKSIRSSQPLMLGFEAGLRFNL